MDKLGRREFLKSAAVTAGLVVVTPTLVSANGLDYLEGEVVNIIDGDGVYIGHDWYTGDYVETEDPGPEYHDMIKSSFQRVMKDKGYTKIHSMEYNVSWNSDYNAYWHMCHAVLS